MIEQILNREFVLERLDEILSQLETEVTGGDRRTGGPVPEEARDLEDADYGEAIAALRQARQRETEATSGQPSFEPPPAERRSEDSPDLDDVSFFSRDPVISNVQSALEQYFEEQEPQRIVTAQDEGDRRNAGTDPVITDRSLVGVEPRRGPDGRRVFDRFSITDVRWVSTLVAAGISKFRKKHPFNATPATPRRIDGRARLLLVGDWGSGIPRALKVAQQMRLVLDQGVAEGIEQHVIHLGDIYYSGWKREVRKRFLDCWPVRQGEPITSWSLNANHDMSSGGHAYYGTLLTDSRFAAQQRSSLFSLFNDRWQIVGLDTAWEDERLCDPQPAWVKAEAEKAGLESRKVMLLSHHQLFSSYESQGEKLEADLGSTLATGRVRSWFWGHEHRCMTYKPYKNVAFASCVGHGGVPVYMGHAENDPLPEPGLYEYRSAIRRGFESWAKFGFTSLDFDGPMIRVRYIDEDGELHRQETIE